MYKWLEKEFADRTVAEMSILHSLFSVGSFIAVFMCSYLFDRESPACFIIAISFWFIFQLWLWIGFVKVAWKSGSERLGVRVFRILQIGIFLVFAITVIPSFRGVEEFKFVFLMILVFDAAIAWLVVNFLFLAWFARCKISFRSYCEIVSIISMVALQVWLLNN